jgi:hypothetical protein
MSSYACLAREYDAVADVRTAGQSYLRAEQRVFSDGTRMSDLYKVVDL